MSAFEQFAVSIYCERKLLQTLGDRFFLYPLKKNENLLNAPQSNFKWDHIIFFSAVAFLKCRFRRTVVVENPSERINAKNIINRLPPSGINEI